MKFLLLVMPVVSREYDSTNRYRSTVIPYGALSIATYVKYYCKDVEVEIIDLNTRNNKKYLDDVLLLKEYVKKREFNIVGFSVMYSGGMTYIKEYADIIKSISESIFIFVGGITASNQYIKILKENESVDAICFGEGEISIKDMIDSNIDYQILDKHKSWATKNYYIDKKLESTYIIDLDEIPFIEYGLVNVEEYCGRMWSNDATTTFPMHATRGCPFNCVFCCSGENHGKRVRYVSPQRFIEDVRRIVEEYKGKIISIDDDQFLLNQKNAKTILNGLMEIHKKYGTMFEFPSGVSVRFLDDEIADLMGKCGIKEISLAIESGSDRMLKHVIDKPLCLEEVQPVVQRLHNNGILAKAFWVIGIPGEKPEDRQMTLEFMKKCGFDWNNIYIAVPFPGSRLYDLCLEKGYITNIDNVEMLVDSAIIKAPYIDPLEMEEIVYLMNLDANFINNHALKTKNIKVALEQFYHITHRYPMHAFGHYCYAQALLQHGDKEGYNNEMEEYKKIVENDEKWKKYAEHFGLL